MISLICASVEDFLDAQPRRQNQSTNPIANGMSKTVGDYAFSPFSMWCKPVIISLKMFKYKNNKPI